MINVKPIDTPMNPSIKLVPNKWEPYFLSWKIQKINW